MTFRRETETRSFFPVSIDVQLSLNDEQLGIDGTTAESADTELLVRSLCRLNHFERSPDSISLLNPGVSNSLRQPDGSDYWR